MNRWTTILLISLFLAGLLGAARLNEPLREARRQYGISQADPMINAPPLVVFSTVALGGFRGIIADILWIRSARLQDEGRYFELVQLADWITKLEPRFTSVWAYHAWNLSYNISVLLKRPEERWRWVRSGISLLRDEGLRYNPGNARLLYELGWLFQHKLGGNSDTAGDFYRRQWAAEMSELWDGPTPDFDTLINAPPTEAALLAQPDVAPLIAQLRAAGRDPFSPARIAEARAAPPSDPLRTSAGQKLIAHLRLRALRDTYKLDPRTMRDLDSRYGPLDWRLPQAHAIYWGWQSLHVATRDFDIISADRMIFQSLGDAFRQGSLYTDPRRNIFIQSPNPALAPRVLAAYDDTLKRFAGNDSILEAKAYFMREAIIVYYSFNQTDAARDLFNQLRTQFPTFVPDANFETFVREEFLARQERLSRDTALSIINGALVQSAFWNTHGDPNRAAGYDHLAQLTWDGYHTRLPAQPTDTPLPPLAEPPQPAAQEVAP
ncbi:MAG: hypothetical protein J5I99_04855 [Verrucomicrobia bacterium]|nr:hypothetical protein [Verrucomicrobiota bacterium]